MAWAIASMACAICGTKAPASSARWMLITACAAIRRPITASSAAWRRYHAALPPPVSSATVAAPTAS